LQELQKARDFEELANHGQRTIIGVWMNAIQEMIVKQVSAKPTSFRAGAAAAQCQHTARRRGGAGYTAQAIEKNGLLGRLFLGQRMPRAVSSLRPGIAIRQ
jgi:hypothetical protein